MQYTIAVLALVASASAAPWLGYARPAAYYGGYGRTDRAFGHTEDANGLGAVIVNGRGIGRGHSDSNSYTSPGHSFGNARGYGSQVGGGQLSIVSDTDAKQGSYGRRNNYYGGYYGGYYPFGGTYAGRYNQGSKATGLGVATGSAGPFGKVYGSSDGTSYAGRHSSFGHSTADITAIGPSSNGAAISRSSARNSDHGSRSSYLPLTYW